ncbi:MAG: ribosome recycling factor [Fusobacteriaceae bacterium]|jgi:ribosome recycling factor|nr:ribosome recycling factor [Fusobacteriaceae bacterium]
MTGKDIVNDCKEKMEKTIEATKGKFANIRAGRASVAILDGIKVDQYGQPAPLKQVATVAAPEARLLTIDPWDKSMIKGIEKAILAANIGLTPGNDGKIIRLVLPELTAERRKEYVKLAKTEAENGKIAIRNIRKDVNNALKKLEKDKANPVSEDEIKKFEDEVQKLTDGNIKLIDELTAKKEKEITTV